MTIKEMRKTTALALGLTVSLLMTTFIVPAHADMVAPQTNVSSCQTISQEGTYDLTQNITTPGTSPCINITGLTGAWPYYVQLNCQGHSITNAYDPGTNVNASVTTVTIGNNSPNDVVYLQNCTFSAPKLGQLGDGGAIIASKDTVLDVQSSTFNNVQFFVDCTNPDDIQHMAIFNNNTFNNSTLQDNQCVGSINGNTFGNLTIPMASGIGDLLTILSTNFTKVTNNTLLSALNTTSNTLSVASNPNVPPGRPLMDDGFVFSQQVPGDVAGRNLDIENNTLSNYWDTCMEALGPWTNVTMKNNTCNNSVNGIFGHYFNASLDHFDVENNTLTEPAGTYNHIFLIEPVTAGTQYPYYFTNNTFINNTATGGSQLDADFGKNQFSTYSGNYFKGNTLAYGNGYVSFQSASGIIDGGGNQCEGALNIYPSSGVINCN